MDACIARGGISHVLSQARASLKNPSRPFTPRTTERPLFHGDDYRPGSRPSSSYSVAEQKEQLATETRKLKGTPTTGPPGAALPPRPIGKIRSARAPSIAPPRSRDSVGKKEEPVAPQDHDSAEDTDPSGDESDHGGAAASSTLSTRSDEHVLESSVEIPSPDALARMLHGITQHLDELGRQQAERVSSQVLDVLVTSLTEFTFSSAGYVTQIVSSRRSPVDAPTVLAMRRRLFDSLVDLAVGTWHTAAKCVIAVTPCILDLFETGLGTDDDARAKVVSLGKVLFVLSKETQHDSDFCNVRYVESTLSLVAAMTPTTASRFKSVSLAGKASACPMKTLIYIAGTLKNVSSGDDKMLKLLATNGAIASLSDALLWRSKDAAEGKEIAQFLVQTTTILRNLSASKAYLKQFNEAQVASRLCEMVDCFLPHHELMVNVSRILGKLTLHEVPRSQINQNVERHVGNLLKLVDPRSNPTLMFAPLQDNESPQSQNQTHAETKTQDVLLVRIFFVLGNLCASNDRNRQFLGVDAAAVPVLLRSLAYYANKYVRVQHRRVQLNADDGAVTEDDRSGECTDVLVKLVRLIANLAMNAEVGTLINTHGDEMAVLLDVLECAQAAGRGDDELMLNIVSCITNLSYYCTASAQPSPSVSFVEAYRLETTSLLSQILWDANEEAVLEAARAFGNLSRFKDVLRAMGDNKVLDGFVILLDHSNREIVYTVCGVLMNAALDELARAKLLNVRQVQSGMGDAAAIDARTLLMNILECAALDDVEMSCIAAKVLYNLLLANKDAATQRYLASDEGQSLQRVVSSILRSLNVAELDDDDDDNAASRRDLCDVLAQLKNTMIRAE